MTGDHVPARLLKQYAGGTHAPADAVWALEAHLESCGACRDRLGELVGADTAALLERVRVGLDAEIASGPRMPARRRFRTKWVPPALLPRLLMTALVVGVALGLDVINMLSGDPFPSFVLLLAPVAPLLGVAAAWSRGMDPAHELVLASPKAGLYMVLRRTLAVLMVVIPLLAGAGALMDLAPVRWLLPCLAFTASALALGELIGLPRAAGGLALLWAAVVIMPSFLTKELSVLLTSASLPGWAGLTAVVVVVLVIRRGAYTELPSGR